jgi:hypothetical protein
MKPTEENVKLFHDFIGYCAKHLGLSGDINIVFQLEKDPSVPSAGQLNPANRLIKVCVGNRAIADCMRTCAHELTHLKQLLVDNAEFPDDDAGLQPYEDEANVMSGRLVRFFGREHPEIYSDL